MQKMLNVAKLVTLSSYVNHLLVLGRTKGNVYLNKQNDTILSLSILDHGILVVDDLFLLL